MSHNTSDPKVLAAMAAHYATKPTQVWNTDMWSIVIDTDSYKVSMWKQYPPGTEYVSSYIEARGGRFPNAVFFGLQAFLKKLERPVTAEEVAFADVYWTSQGMPFNRAGWDYIVNELGGKLPIRIEAVEEGRVVPIKNALVQIVNTDPKCFWLTTWVETSLVRAVWYPTGVCTLSWSIKQIYRKFHEETSDAEIGIEEMFKLHDFGSRGVSSYESAELGGMAHLINFSGTDTGAAVLGAMKFYDAKIDPKVNPDTGFPTSPGYSIPAMEHSTITSWGRDHEIEAVLNMIDQYGGPNMMLAVVGDSYDIYHFASDIVGTKLKEMIEGLGGRFVVRPDSGDPTTVPVDIVEILGEKFGYTTNSKGYKVLPPYIRVIQGDGINMDSIIQILTNLKAAGWSVENIVFGMGGALLQQSNRDSMGWAMKCSAIKRAGQTKWIDVFKDPITDPDKKSKRGRLALVLSRSDDSVGYYTVPVESVSPEQNLLKPVYQDGEVLRWTSWESVKARSEEREGVLSVLPLAA